MTGIKILICDDHPIFRYGLKTLLEKDGFLVFEASDGTEAVNITVQCHPDLIIMDYILPQMTGLKVIESIQKTGLQQKAILLSSVYDEELIEQSRQLKIDAYISKNNSLENIYLSITRVLAGKRLVNEPFINVNEENNSKNPFNILTQREIEVVYELTTGKTQHIISEKLGVSVRTIEKHRENITQKLGKMSLVELTKKAFIWGLIPDNR